MAAIIDDATGLVDTSDVVLHSFVSEGGGGGGDSDGDGSKDGSGELDRPYYDSLNGGGSGGSCGGGASQSAAVPQIQNLSLIEGNSPGMADQLTANSVVLSVLLAVDWGPPPVTAGG